MSFGLTSQQKGANELLLEYYQSPGVCLEYTRFHLLWKDGICRLAGTEDEKWTGNYFKGQKSLLLVRESVLFCKHAGGCCKINSVIILKATFCNETSTLLSPVVPQITDPVDWLCLCEIKNKTSVDATHDKSKVSNLDFVLSLQPWKWTDCYYQMQMRFNEPQSLSF